jgi:hypothetical protein
MGPYVDGLRAWLLERGYTPGSIKQILTLAGQLGRWMQNSDVKSSHLDPATVESFLDALRARGVRRVPGPPSQDGAAGGVGCRYPGEHRQRRGDARCGQLVVLCAHQLSDLKEYPSLVQPDLPIHLAAVLGSADRSRAHFLPPVWDSRAAALWLIMVGGWGGRCRLTVICG